MKLTLISMIALSGLAMAVLAGATAWRSTPAASAAPPAAWDQSVTFTFTTQGMPVGFPGAEFPFVVEMYTEGTTTLVESFAPTSVGAVSGGLSRVSVTIATLATYDIWVKGDNTLAQLLASQDLSTDPGEISLGELKGADWNQDNIVDISDYSAMIAVFNAETISLTAAQRRNDFNHDGIVDLTDYAIQNINNLLTGDPRPS